MMKVNEISERTFRNTALVATCVTLLIYALVLTSITFKIRSNIQEQIVSRDAEALYPFTQLSIEKALALYGEGVALEVDSDLVSVVLETSELKNVVGVKIYSKNGILIDALPEVLDETTLDSEAVRKVQALENFSRFHAQANVAQLFFYEDAYALTEAMPLVEALVPLHKPGSKDILAIAQYYIDGSTIKTEFHALDTTLWAQAAAAFLAGGILLGMILVISFRHLRGVNRLLEERSRRLAQANADLALSAKTSALGTVTAHIIHGLKNPLANLQLFVDSGKNAPEEADWNSAHSSTHRMREMIDEMISVIKEEEAETSFDFTFEEIRECILNKAQVLCDRADLSFVASLPPQAQLDSRRTNLLLPILMNLIENAVQATPAGGKVSLDFKHRGSIIRLIVSDTGSGLSEYAKAHLFNPVSSTKEGGSGVGLVISSHLAKHIGAQLNLERSDQQGTSFSVTIDLETKIPSLLSEHSLN